MFILPKLECVYKFDYYIDPEDLYDHNHDENRLWDDAYQHLFLGRLPINQYELYPTFHPARACGL